jgi:hypothetical protein
MLLVIDGAVGIIAGAVGLLVAAFRESFVWGLGCLLLPIVGLLFMVLHWDRARKPFLLKLAGVGIVVAGVFLRPR